VRHNGAVSDASESPFLTLSRSEWAALADSTPLPLTEEDIARVRGLGDPVDLDEVDTIYRPLSRLLDLYSDSTGRLHAATSEFLGERASRTPFIIGIAGSVAVGKSTTARVVRELMARWPGSPRVELITTDGFLYPNSVLEQRGLLERKGFPESYDRRALRQFIWKVKSGAAEVHAPRYSHITYDIVPGGEITVSRPDILIVEGLNVLQAGSPPKDGKAIPYVSDFFDFSVYIDAEEDVLHKWYVDRFLTLRETAFRDPKSYFHRYSNLDDAQATATAASIWERINLINLRENILPTRQRADLILKKAANHFVQDVSLRKL